MGFGGGKAIVGSGLTGGFGLGAGRRERTVAERLPDSEGEGGMKTVWPQRPHLPRLPPGSSVTVIFSPQWTHESAIMNGVLRTATPRASGGLLPCE